MENNELLQNQQPIIEKITAEDLDKANTLTKEEFIHKFDALLDMEEQLERNQKTLKVEESQDKTIFLDEIKSEEDIEKVCKKLNITVEELVKTLEKEADEEFDAETVELLNGDVDVDSEVE